MICYFAASAILFMVNWGHCPWQLLPPMLKLMSMHILATGFGGFCLVIRSLFYCFSALVQKSADKALVRLGLPREGHYPPITTSNWYFSLIDSSGVADLGLGWIFCLWHIVRVDSCLDNSCPSIHYFVGSSNNLCSVG